MGNVMIKAEFLEYQSHAGIQDRLEKGGKKQSWGDALEDFVGIPGIHEYLDYDINSTNEK